MDNVYFSSGVLVGVLIFLAVMFAFGNMSIWYYEGYHTAVCESQGYEYNKTVDGRVFCGDKLQTTQYSESPVFDKKTKTWINLRN